MPSARAGFDERRFLERGWRWTPACGTLGSVELVTPSATEVDDIHQAYLSVALSGEESADHYRRLTALANALVRQGAETIILAGTDLSVIFNEVNTQFPHIDCARVHIEAIVRAVTRVDA